MNQYLFKDKARKPLICRFLLLSLLVIIAYFPTFSGEFILDDAPLIEKNHNLKDFQSWSFYLTQEDGIVNDFSGEYNTGYYRPLINLTYTIDYKIWGMNPAGFRTTNLLLHLITCLILFYVLRDLTKIKSSLIWIAVIIFALHPANTESVSWVASRNNILVTMFSLLSFYFYTKKKQHSIDWPKLLAVFFFGLAILCKEFAVVILPIILLYEYIVNGRGVFNRDFIITYLSFIAVFALYIFLRSNVVNSLIMPPQAVYSWENLLFAPYLFIYYFRIILFPFGLHQFIINYPEDNFSVIALLGYIGLSLIVWLIWRFRNNRLILFSSISFFISFLPVLNIIPTPSVSLISMRWVYFPMVFLMVIIVKMLPNSLQWRLTLPSVLVGTGILYLGIYTYVLNEYLWKTEERFFKNEVLLFGNDVFMVDLARVLHIEGDYAQSEKYFLKALESDNVSEKDNVYIDYAALLINTGRARSALDYLDTAERSGLRGERLGPLFNNKGAAYFKLNDIEKAVKYLKMAVRVSSYDKGYSINLANAYRSVERFDEALLVLEKSLEMAGESFLLHKNLGITYMAKGNFDAAIKYFELIPVKEREKDPEVNSLIKQAYSKINQ